MVALIEARDLTKAYKSGGVWRPAVDKVSFTISPGQTLGIVGASGSGKSTLARLIVGLEAPDEGELLWKGQALRTPRSTADRKNMSMVFQSPIASLNPRMSIGDIVAEPLDLEGSTKSASDRRDAVQAVLADVGLDASVLARKPHELSGGQQQRVAIARALCTQPRLLVADEPLSALDVSVGAQIANLLMDLQERFGLAYIFISHDLNMVSHLAHDVLVMKQS